MSCADITLTGLVLSSVGEGRREPVISTLSIFCGVVVVVVAGGVVCCAQARRRRQTDDHACATARSTIASDSFSAKFVHRRTPRKNDLKRRGDRVAARILQTAPHYRSVEFRAMEMRRDDGGEGELLQFRYRFAHVATNAADLIESVPFFDEPNPPRSR